jgi:hypothetical protein
MALLPEIKALLDRQAASGRPPLHRQSVEQARAFHVQDAPALNGHARIIDAQRRACPRFQAF